MVHLPEAWATRILLIGRDDVVFIGKARKQIAKHVRSHGEDI
jgi:hypothetical protein